jgi:hypothetical protein
VGLPDGSSQPRPLGGVNLADTGGELDATVAPPLPPALPA